jgi:hypothetical protein
VCVRGGGTSTSRGWLLPSLQRAKHQLGWQAPTVEAWARQAALVAPKAQPGVSNLPARQASPPSPRNATARPRAAPAPRAWQTR